MLNYWHAIRFPISTSICHIRQMSATNGDGDEAAIDAAPAHGDAPRNVDSQVSKVGAKKNVERMWAKRWKTVQWKVVSLKAAQDAI